MARKYRRQHEDSRKPRVRDGVERVTFNPPTVTIAGGWLAGQRIEITRDPFGLWRGTLYGADGTVHATSPGWDRYGQEIPLGQIADTLARATGHVELAAAVASLDLSRIAVEE